MRGCCVRSKNNRRRTLTLNIIVIITRTCVVTTEHEVGASLCGQAVELVAD